MCINKVDYWDQYWLHLYVALSRVRTMDQMLLYGELRRFVFEQRPHEWLREKIQMFDIAAAKHLKVMDEALRLLGWVNRGDGHFGPLELALARRCKRLCALRLAALLMQLRVPSLYTRHL